MKYNNYFWEYRIKNEKDTWGGLVSDKILNRDSIFIQTNMYHHKDVHNEWTCHGEDCRINYAVEESRFLLEDLWEDIKEKYGKDLEKVTKVLEEIDRIPTDNREEFINHIKDLSYRFNNIWTQTEMNFYFEVYGSPEEYAELTV